MDSYRRVLRHPGALRFSVAALVARLPISMVGLGIVLLVQAETGSYGVAGTVSAAYVLAQAAAAMLHGRLLDSLGQARRPLRGRLRLRGRAVADDAVGRAGAGRGR